MIMATPHTFFRPRRTRSSGVVLVIALILMAVIAMTASVAIKSVSNGDQISNNLRNANLAQQAAEAGLRWCEDQARSGLPGIAIAPVGEDKSKELWQDIANWAGATRVPAAILTDTYTSSVRYKQLPQCMAQEVQLEAGLMSDDDLKRLPNIKTYRITVRAYSPDYNRDNARRGSGSEMWLQSLLWIRPAQN